MTFSVVYPLSTKIVVPILCGERLFVYKIINNGEEIIFVVFTRLCNFFDIGLELGSLDFRLRSADSIALIVTKFGVFTENGSSFCTTI